MKILIRLPNWLGDVVMSTSFVTAVKQLYPGAQIDVIIKQELRGIVNLIPGIDNVYPFSKQEFEGLSGVYRFGKALRNQQYDIFFNLPPSLSSATMAFATRAKKRVGFGTEGGFLLLTKACKHPQNVHRVREYISLLEQFTGKPVPSEPVKIIAHALVNEPKQLLVNFNSEAESRRMPVDKGIALLNLLLNTFADITIGMIGAPKDAEHVNAILAGVTDQDRIVNHAGQTSLNNLASLMAGTAALLTVDSGPAHLANSIGLPVVVLFGAGNEHNTEPFNLDDMTVIRAGELSCEPCVRNTCKLYGIPKCMQLLNETKIIEALSKYLNHA
ncbi:lipopolysaccharide heptosyltransferase II [Mucilaginibacter sp. UR6-1]|uniref:lipopolysaccharide heptosyltransferase II n=1 Tax=Mucilaginibacter sp. UR6-1 TaxID=1435643 RepID=UPI001E61376B|nr:lipopolysaccharide heptosyltransferase II [Mucilaginibacter sp. UR6-1]MCC8408876.1 lipopolysaccharide heptosyltransferase II [Mucilaginibacter sp. UR6-1]